MTVMYIVRGVRVTNISLVSFLWDIGSIARNATPHLGLEEFHRKMEYEFKITPDAPKHDNRLTHNNGKVKLGCK